MHSSVPSIRFARRLCSQSKGCHRLYTLRITGAGIEDTRNDIMMYSFIEAESLDAAAELFKEHPHFGIPNSWIEVMAVNKAIG